MPMTVYEKAFVRTIETRYGTLAPGEIARKMIEMGVVDMTLCKVLCIREFIADRLKEGVKKIDAMWLATEHFACSYEYVRKCVYYYTDIRAE